MKDRHTDQLRHVLRLAENEAQRLGHDYVGTEHLFVAVLREEANAGARALAALGVDLDRARKALAAVPRHKGGDLAVAAPARTPRARAALQSAAAEADRYGPGSPVGPEHLLLALISDPDGLAAQLLLDLGLSADRLRAAVVTGWAAPTEITSAVPAPAVGPATSSSDAVQAGRQVEATRPREQAALPPPVANLAVPAPAVARPVERPVWLTTLAHCWQLFLYLLPFSRVPNPAGEAEPPAPGLALPGGVRLTKEARQVMHLAEREARQMRHNYVGTEHVLLGLVREGTGPAAQVLSQLGIDLLRVRTEVLKAVANIPPTQPEGRLALTAWADDVLRRASAEAQADGKQAGPEHLLLGLLRQQEGVAAQVLLGLGLTAAGVRGQLRVLGDLE